MDFDDIYTSCPNCGSYVDRMDIDSNNMCSDCRLQVTFDGLDIEEEY